MIPCRNEFEDFLELFESLHRISAKNFLVILIVNSPKDADPQEFETNEKLIGFLCQSSLRKIQKNFFSCLAFENFDLLILDFGSSPTFGLPRSQGVGGARKWGCDIAARLFFERKLEEAWVSSTDADVILPNDYFFSEPNQNFACYHYKYRHFTKNKKLQTPSEIYEIYLRYHRLGLAYAQSPYAYPSIGSCLRINLIAYAKCHGFPVRQAGEDFYLLNKLAKQADICWAPSSPLQIQARDEVRTPFGTSVSVSKILADQLEFKVYAPQTYSELRQILNFFPEFSSSLDAKDFQLQLQKLGLHGEILKILDLENLLNFLRQFKDKNIRLKRLHENFDAWKSLKWIHARPHPRQPWLKALKSAPFLNLRAFQDSFQILEDLRAEDEKRALAP